MIAYCIDNLSQIKHLTQVISKELYTKPCDLLFKSSVGQHTRHALEFYLCLFKGLDESIVNYDERKRQYDIETFPNVASETIDEIIKKLKAVDKNKTIEVKANYTSDDNDEVCMNSTLYRELGFCLEHTIHHQALVKTGLKEIECLDLVNQYFGVAPSTLRNMKKCAQ